jgi:hypothetical protein
MGLRDIGKKHVRAALAECKQLGELSFLDKYGFRPARRFLLVHRGRYYQSKAIIGAAHGFATGTPFTAYNSSGGKRHAVQALRALDFEVVDKPFDDWLLWPHLDRDARLLRGHLPRWKRWSDRFDFVDEMMWPGVYVIGRFFGKPRRVFPLPKQVVYVGQTKRTLSERLKEFHVSAMGGTGHSGGCSFHKNYGPRLLNVWVSVLPVRLPPGEQAGAITVLEGLLIWSYSRCWKRPPECNSK